VTSANPGTLGIASTKTNGPQRWDQGATDAQERRFFATTNCIENLIGTLRHVTRNIKRWRDGDMRRRWIGLGLVRSAERCQASVLTERVRTSRSPRQGVSKPKLRRGGIIDGGAHQRAEEVPMNTPEAAHGTKARCERYATILLIVATALAGCSAMQKPLAGTVAINEPIAQPVWKVGNEWAYRYKTPSGTGTFVWRLDRMETLANEPHYVITAGTREIFYRVADFGFTKEALEGKIVRQISPSTWRPVAFPLSVGLSWDMKYLETRPTEQQTENVERRCVAEAEEALTVPAGTFATIRIVCKNMRNNSWVITVWYSPEVNHMVKDEYPVRTGGRGSRELLMFRLK